MRYLNEMYQVNSSIRNLGIMESTATGPSTYYYDSTNDGYCQSVKNAEITAYDYEHSINSGHQMSLSLGSVATSKSNGYSSPSEGELLIPDADNQQTKYASVAIRQPFISCLPLNRVPAHVNSQHLNMETILRNVYLSCTHLSFSDSQQRASGEVSAIATGPQTRF